MSIIVTAGHVDHGKSSLVRAITGIDPDRLAEEKRRGMTIELGFAHTTRGATTLSFVDAPGHADLVRTMIAGASAVGAALLVVDAKEGWMPQTHEHLAVLELLGITRGVVAITKCDLVDENRLTAVRHETEEIVSSSTIDWIATEPVSVVTGLGLDQLTDSLVAASAAGSGDSNERRTRLFIDRVFTIAGAGTVVTGTLDHGVVRPGDSLDIARTKNTVRVRSVETHGVPVDVARAGLRCALNLPDVSVDDVRRGDALVAPGAWQVTDVFDVALSPARGQNALPDPGGGYSVHVGTDRQACTVRPLPVQGAYRVRVSAGWPLAPGDRIVLRRTGDSTTVAGGVVLDVAPRRRISHSRPEGTIETQLVDHGWIDVARARQLTGLDVEPVVGRWCAAPSLASSTIATLSRALDDGEVRLDRLEPWERELVSTFDDVAVEAGVARRGAAGGLEHDPVGAEIRSWGVTGPGTAQFPRDIIRRLIAAGVIVEHDGIAFHRDTLEELRPMLTELFDAHPDGVTVSMLRERLGITRKHAVPLAACLDRTGHTVRRGDARFAGPRLRG
jgi:selenocysteine-specific elongation factor